MASAPNQVWSWDITYLRSPMHGVFFYLYLAVDIYSRKLVGWRVEFEESAEPLEARQRSNRSWHVDADQLVLHADNGSPMKNRRCTTLQRLGVVPSFSRPSVSDDNPFSEALFRTLKYRPGFPRKPFATLRRPAEWVAGFVTWYNDEHLHSAIRYVTPSARHLGRDATGILMASAPVYRAAKKRRMPRRWTGDIRNWSPVGAVYLNPVKQEVHIVPIAKAL